jgi:hypothetical protein
VFLEKYTLGDIHYNSVVSVFLYTIEYCQGIILLIINYITEFNLVALSRIYLKVKYNDLKSKAKSKV